MKNKTYYILLKWEEPKDINRQNVLLINKKEELSKYNFDYLLTAGTLEKAVDIIVSIIKEEHSQTNSYKSKL